MTLIVAHKNCMDGLAAATMTAAYFDLLKKAYVVYFINYGESTESLYISQASDIIFVDFSLSREEMISMCNIYNSVTVLDHHKTAKANLEGLTTQFPDIYSEIFDMERSGAMIVYDHFIKGTELEENYDKQLIEYIQDRDLWQWKLPNSEKVNEGLRHVVEMNNIKSFNDTCECLTPFNLANRGSTLIEAKEKYVKQVIQCTKSIVLQDTEFECINSTIHISEVGNAICNKYHKPAAVYQISSDGTKVWWSLRSLDSLLDASIIAKAMSGGGHRNACGFETTLEELCKILTN